MPERQQDLAGTTLAVLFIGGLIGASLWIIGPFLPAIVWAATLVVATWPLMLRIERLCGNRRWIAVLAMTLALLLVLVVPFWLAISTVLANAEQIGTWVRMLLSLHVPEPPDWLAEVPLIGPRAAEAWAKFTSAGVSDLAPMLAPYAGSLTRWFVGAVGSLGGMFVQFLLTVAVAAVMYAGGEQAAAIALRFGHRLGGDRGAKTVHLAGQAIRGVALGVVVTALVQSIIGGVGLEVVGLPYAPVLAALMFILCLAQLGPAPVLIPAVIWMYYSSHSTIDTVWATVLLVFATVALTIDNFLRPILIRRGAHLPILLILAGVIGGLIAMGLLGIFLGPAILAVAYTLLNAWMEEGAHGEPAARDHN
jgi:predicted PurR-regulated permease PerM